MLAAAMRRYRANALTSTSMRCMATADVQKMQTDICIVGCGPVGMTLALILNKFNKRCLILERDS